MASYFAEQVWPLCVRLIAEALRGQGHTVDDNQLDKQGEVWTVMWKQFLFLAGVLPTEGYNLVLVPRDEDRNKTILNEVIAGDQCYWASVPTALTIFVKAKCVKQGDVKSLWDTNFPMEGWSAGGADCRLVHPRGGSNVRIFNEAATKEFAARLTEWNVKFMLETSSEERKSGRV